MRAPRYVVWKGDEVIAIGTVSEIAQRLGVSPSTVKWWATPAAHRRADEGTHARGRKVAERIE